MKRILVAVALATALGGAAFARPGGGHSFGGGGGGHYSGGGGHYSGGHYHSGGGKMTDGEAVAFLIVIGVLGVVSAVSKAVGASRNRFSSDSDVGSFTTSEPETPPPSLDDVRADDPSFSQVLFEDFVYALYARAQHARNEAIALDRLAPYLSTGARAALRARGDGARPVEAALIGSMSILRVARHGTPASFQVRIALETNLVLDGGTEYAREQWVLRRQVGAQTRPWKGARTFDCPNCGAHAESWDDLTCASCGQQVEGGRFDWMVDEIETDDIEQRGPSLTGTTEEQGTHSPTIMQDGVDDAWATLVADDPTQTRDALRARLGLVYDEMNRSWNAQDVSIVRPYVSDGQFGYLRYWNQAYRAQQLRNMLDDARLTRWKICKVTRDACYDAVTVRIWGTGLDYTLDAHDQVVGGSRTSPRAYSEYWTLIRGAGVRGAPRSTPICPSCGAELAVGMSGACKYCLAIVSRGDFDWVLSKIEQDESYRG